MGKPYIIFDITPDSNIDYAYRNVKENSLVTRIKCGFNDPMTIEINGVQYVYRAYDLDLNEHRLVHNGVLHRLLGRLTVG